MNTIAASSFLWHVDNTPIVVLRSRALPCRQHALALLGQSGGSGLGHGAVGSHLRTMVEH